MEVGTIRDADPDIGPIMQWKWAGEDRPCWEDISPESRETKVLWRQWERLHLVRGVLYRWFHELEGQGWRHYLAVLRTGTRSPRRSDRGPSGHGAHSRFGGIGFLLARDAS